MAAQVNIPVYSDALVALGTAGVIVPLAKRLGLSPVFGFLAAGALLGPLGLGTFAGQVPALYWFTVSDIRNVAGIVRSGRPARGASLRGAAVPLRAAPRLYGQSGTCT